MKQLLLVIFTLSIFNLSCKQQSLKIMDGFVKTDDGINLFYSRIGPGSEIVIIPAGMYLADAFKRLSNNKSSFIRQ